MALKNLPKEKEWDYFWSLDQTEKFKKESWSKKRIMRILSRLLSKDMKVLDAGCGSGFFSGFFCDSGIDTCSLDYSQEALDICNQITSGRSKLLKKDILDPILSDDISQKFDLIFTDGLLEHFLKDDQSRILINFRNLLVSDGLIVTFVPNKWSPWQLIRPFYMPGIVEYPFTLRKLVDLNEKNGMKVISKGGVNTFPFKFSPDNIFGELFGMLLYTISQKN